MIRVPAKERAVDSLSALQHARLLERFEKNVDRRDDGCWDWTGVRHGKPYRHYGYVGFNGVRISAHRLAYHWRYGPVPDGLTVDHLCRNTLCVNPAHLEAVTNRENILRGNGVPSRNARKTHCKRGHTLGGENLLRLSNGDRICRTCQRARQSTPEYLAKQKERQTRARALRRAEAQASVDLSGATAGAGLDPASGSPMTPRGAAHIKRPTPQPRLCGRGPGRQTRRS